MDIVVRKMTVEDWDAVAEIYKQGVDTNMATFQSDIPTYEDWNNSHLEELRYVACINQQVVGWIALSPISSRCVYRGVCEVSVYVHKDFAGNGIASKLYNIMIEASEKAGIWTLQVGIMEDNVASVQLHKKVGFREVGYRERIGKDRFGNWRNIILMERRSKVIE